MKYFEMPEIEVEVFYTKDIVCVDWELSEIVPGN